MYNPPFYPPYQWMIINTIIVLCMMGLFGRDLFGLLIGVIAILISTFILIPIVEQQDIPWWRSRVTGDRV